MRTAFLVSALLVFPAVPAFAQVNPQQMSTPTMERNEYGAGNGSHDPGTPSSSIAAERKRLNSNDPEGIAEDLRLLDGEAVPPPAHHGPGIGGRVFKVLVEISYGGLCKQRS